MIFFKHIQKKYINYKKGFTLLESLVAIFILLLSLTGPIYIATLGIRTAAGSRDGISARYLAEEVVEYFRNERDYRSLREVEFPTVDWLKNITGTADCKNPPGAITNVCQLQINPSTLKYVVSECAGLGTCSKLRFNPTSAVAFYGVDDTNATLSKFSREFYFETAAFDGNATENPKREVRLVVRILWNDHGKNKVYTVTEYLHNLAYSKYVK